MIVKWYIDQRCKELKSIRGEMKKTNLFNPQVALTDKYGNDFGFLFVKSKWNAKNVFIYDENEKQWKGKFAVKCETTDNQSDEWMMSFRARFPGH